MRAIILLAVITPSVLAGDLIFESNFEDLCAGQAIAIPRQSAIKLPVDAGGDLVASIWDEVVGSPFGSSTGNNTNFAMQQGEYVALLFDAPLAVFNNKKTTFEFGRPSEGGPAPYTVTISQCAGDFSTHLNQDRCKRSGSSPTLKWTTNPAETGRCILEPGARYYFNIVHSSDEEGGYVNSDCLLQPNFETCGVLLNEVGVN